jgi:hypothetical protein
MALIPRRFVISIVAAFAQGLQRCCMQLKALMAELRGITGKVHLVEPKPVPWFPTSIANIDNFSTKTLDAGLWAYRRISVCPTQFEC